MMVWGLISAPLMAALALLVVSLGMVLGLSVSLKEGLSVLMEWDLVFFGPVSMKFPVLVDSMSLCFALTVVVISFSVMLFTSSYMSNDYQLEYFTYMVMLFVLSMNFLVFIPSLFILLLGWDGLGLTSYLLVIYYQNGSSMAAGMITAMTNRVGDALLIIAGSWAGMGAHWNYVFSFYHVTYFLGGCIMVAAMTKSAQLPFSSWLPAAMAAPTPVSSLVHSSTLVTAGVYLLIRFFPALSAVPMFTSYILYSGVMTCLMASVAAFVENDLKKVIALSTLSQLGVMMVALGLNQPHLAFYHLITHALFKALLFLCAGTVIHANESLQDIRFLGQLWNSMPGTCVAFNTANLALCGFPFLAGFYSKDLIMEIFMVHCYPLITSSLLLISVCLTSAYSIRLSIMTMWTPYKGSPLKSVGDEGLMNHMPFFILLVGAVSMGPVLSQFLTPNVELLVLPVSMKVLVIMGVFLMSLVAFLMHSISKTLVPFHFLSSMWFLSWISSSPSNFLVMKCSTFVSRQEMTWMEMIMSVGLVRLSNYCASKFQLTQEFSSPQLFSYIMVGLLFFMAVYMVS